MSESTKIQSSRSFESIRATAQAMVTRLGFPEPKTEDWKHTPASQFAKFYLPGETHSLENNATSAPHQLRVPREKNTFSYLDGTLIHAPETDSTFTFENQVETLSLQPFSETDFFNALNASQLKNCLNLTFTEKSADQETVLTLHQHTQTGKSHTRFHIRAEKSSKATLILKNSSESANPTLQNTHVETALEENAELTLLQLDRQGEQGAQLMTHHFKLAKNSKLNILTITAQGALVRNQSVIRLEGEHAKCSLKGVTLSGSNAHYDQFTHLFHDVPHTQSETVYKSVAAANGRAIFTGRIYVAKNAQKTDAQQLSRALLLNPKAEIHAKPHLEIHADDVKCSHGSTIGQLDKNSLFYLRSRGISENESKNILTRAFCADLIQELSPEFIRKEIETALDQRLSALTEGNKHA